jgi:heme oxygenase (biliverdin-IX-beta and delta-forming)
LSRNDHFRPGGDAEPLLYDPDVPTPTHGERSRTLVAGLRTGTLSTIARQPAGFPHGSFVTFAMDAADPVFFISLMAEHTKNLELDPRASLLVAETGHPDPLANGRVTLLGKVRRLPAGAEAERARAAYLAAHPNASYYVEYADFAFWRLGVEAVRYIGGYGRMSWVELEEYRSGMPDPIAPHAAGLLAHMNADHAATLADYCRAFTKAKDARSAVMSAIDRYGFEMSAVTERGPRPIRLAFPAPISTPEDARRELIALAERARALLRPQRA